MALTFNQRIKIGEFVEDTFAKFFEYRKITVVPVAKSLQDGLKASKVDTKVTNALKSDEMKRNRAAVMFRYAPDFILFELENTAFKNAMFFDVKAMFTPVFLNTFHKQLEEAHGEKIPLYNVANIEREAFDSYHAYHAGGAKVFLMLACSYHKKNRSGTALSLAGSGDRSSRNSKINT